MSFRLNNTSFRLNNGSVSLGTRAIQPTSALGVIYRFSTVDVPLFLNPQESYTNPLNVSSTITLFPPNVVYVYVKSGSLQDQVTPFTTYITNMFFEELFDGTSQTTAPFTEQLITTVGSGTWTKPTGVTQVVVECWGGGGAGGGSTVNDQPGSGGAGGSYARKFISYPSASQNISYTVAAGGIGGTGNGGTGGDTTWETNVVVAKGSTGGFANDFDGTNFFNRTGSVQLGSIGDVVNLGLEGYPAGPGRGGAQSGAGGEGAGSISGNINEFGGNQAAAVVPSEIGSSNGFPGELYGGGGSGAAKISGANRSGGSGAQGLIRILYR